MRLKSFVMAAAAMMLLPAGTRAQQWTLEQCIAHALEHNIQIQQARVEQERGDVSLWQARGQLFPNLSFSTSHSLGYRPFEESTQMVHDGQVTTSSNKTTYSGSYALSANVTLWNGGINYQNIKAQKLQNQITELCTEQREQTLQEQIATLYVQILYSREAVEVNRQMEETARSQYERAQVMQQQGQMSSADVKQMEAQWRSAQYDIVSGETALADYKRQLKSLLQLPVTDDFDVAARV
ncbi:MAG: TolC family protein, partial [Bacteroidaceae bacterium]|nr:TolC family protein [Bacteroidaceae bacterium]